MYNKATKTNGCHDHFVKEGNSPQSIEREEEKKTHKENNADILKRISFLKFLFFWLCNGESDSYENVAVLFQWFERMEDNRQARKRNPKQDV